MNVFCIGAAVAIEVSGEVGVVIGKAEYLEGGTQYQVHYKDANGCAKTEWLCLTQLCRPAG